MPKEKIEKKAKIKVDTISIERFSDSYAKLSDPKGPYKKAFIVWAKTKKINKMCTFNEWKEHFNKFLKDKI